MLISGQKHPRRCRCVTEPSGQDLRLATTNGCGKTSDMFFRGRATGLEGQPGEHALNFERMAAEEKNQKIKAVFEKQAAATMLHRPSRCGSLGEMT